VGGNVDLLAGRILLEKWEDLVRRRDEFAVETTLSSKSFAPRILRMQEIGYEFHLCFFWLPGVELSIHRVAERVRRGGHDIPEAVIRRRYRAGLSNLHRLYLPLADTWRVYDNSGEGNPKRVAYGRKGGIVHIEDEASWNRIREGGTDGSI
jgi:predicted ABC-type ATPase